LLDESLANVPEEFHEPMCTNVRVNREILAAWQAEFGDGDAPGRCLRSTGDSEVPDPSSEVGLYRLPVRIAKHCGRLLRVGVVEVAQAVDDVGDVLGIELASV